MDFKEKERLFYKAAAMQSGPGKWPRPPFVPSRVQVLRTVRGDGPFSRNHVKPGEYDCESNQFGAVSVMGSQGNLLGLYPREFVILDWAENPHLVEGEYEDILTKLHALVEMEQAQS